MIIKKQADGTTLIIGETAYQKGPYLITVQEHESALGERLDRVMNFLPQKYHDSWQRDIAGLSNFDSKDGEVFSDAVQYLYNSQTMRELEKELAGLPGWGKIRLRGLCIHPLRYLNLIISLVADKEAARQRSFTTSKNMFNMTRRYGYSAECLQTLYEWALHNIEDLESKVHLHIEAKEKQSKEDQERARIAFKNHKSRSKPLTIRMN